MTWLANNWFIIVAGLAFVAFHFFGHRGHGGHGGSGRSGGGHGGHSGHGEAPPAAPPAAGQANLPQSGALAVPAATDPTTSGETPAKPHRHGGGHC